MSILVKQSLNGMCLFITNCNEHSLECPSREEASQAALKQLPNAIRLKN